MSGYQQDTQAAHRIREELVCQRTAKANQIRGLIGEYGIVAPKGIAYLRSANPRWLEDGENRLTDTFRVLLQGLYADLRQCDERVVDSLKPLKQGQDEDLHDLMAERYECRSTIITSNLDISEWGEAFPNKLLGAATPDRLRHRAHQVVLDGKSYCSPPPLMQPSETAIGQAPETEK